MERCNFWKNKIENLLCWQGLVLLDWSWQVRTCPNHAFWFNLARFGFKIRFLTKFLNDSAWFLLEKHKKHDKFADKKWKGVISEKLKAKTCVADQDLSSWTGLGRSGHVQITTFWSNLARFGLKIRCLMKFINDSAWFLLEKLKNHIISPKSLIFNQKSRKYQTNLKNN